MSTNSPACGVATLLENSRITLAAAAISDTVSTLIRSPVKIAAICSGNTSPRIIWRIKSVISS
jgi:hypothetical protein